MHKYMQKIQDHTCSFPPKSTPTHFVCGKCPILYWTGNYLKAVKVWGIQVYNSKYMDCLPDQSNMSSWFSTLTTKMMVHNSALSQKVTGDHLDARMQTCAKHNQCRIESSMLGSLFKTCLEDIHWLIHTMSDCHHLDIGPACLEET